MNFCLKYSILPLAIFYLIQQGYSDGVVEKATDPEQVWKVVRNSMKENKRSMCSYLLVQVSNTDFSLNLEKVTGLFEQALDHMARATEFTQKIQHYMNEEALARYDESGGLTVLEISEDRKNLIHDYKEASSEEEKNAILEEYFYKACAQKLGTIIAEKSMFTSVLKVEDFERKRDVQGPNRIKSLARKQSRRQ